MTLAKPEILKALKRKEIVIRPFSLDQVTPASINLTLDSTFRVFPRGRKQVDVLEDTDFRRYTKEVIAKDRLVMKPLQTVLGITREHITLADNICGWLEGRSRFARLGLTIHITAAFVQPGSDNKQVLEMTNIGPNTLVLHPGTRVAQLILERTQGKAKYRGKFQNQRL